VISGHSQLLLRRLEAGSPLRVPVEKIGIAAGQAANMTRQLLCFSRKRSTEFQVLDLSERRFEFSEAVSSDSGRVHRIDGETGPQAGKVRGDAGQLDQVLMNLVVNARQAMPQGGRLTIETANLERSAPPSLQTAKTGRSLYRLSVADQGCGMDAGTKARISNRFSRPKKRAREPAWDSRPCMASCLNTAGGLK